MGDLSHFLQTRRLWIQPASNIIFVNRQYGWKCLFRVSSVQPW